MLNRPFSSFNSNVIEERFQNVVPATVCGQNVIVSQEQQQRVFNNLTTSIAGIPGGYLVQQPQPNTVTFSFNNNPGFFQQPQYYCQYPQPNQTLDNLQRIQQANALDLLQFQQHLTEPYQLKFHLDNQTSTSDLNQTQNNLCRPNINHLTGINLLDNWPQWLDKPKSRNHRKLILKTVTAKLEENICDNLEDENTKNKKVSFDDEKYKDEEVQVHTCCNNLDENKEEIHVKPKKGRRRRKSSYSENTDDDTR